MNTFENDLNSGKFSHLRNGGYAAYKDGVLAYTAKTFEELKRKAVSLKNYEIEIVSAQADVHH